MIITDTLNGHTVEDVRRTEGGVRFYTDSGRQITLYVDSGGLIAVKPPKLILPDQPEVPITSPRMKLLESFQGYMIKYAAYTSEGFVMFVCESLRHNTQQYAKSCGIREITLTHSNGRIDELPKVTARIMMVGQEIFNRQGYPG